MAADKHVYPWYFGDCYDLRINSLLPKATLFISGDNPGAPTAKLGQSGKPQSGLNWQQFYKVMEAVDLTIELPSSHLNSPLVTNLLLDCLPFSKFLKTLTVKLTDVPEPGVNPSLENYQEIVAAFAKNNATVSAISFIDNNDQEIEIGASTPTTGTLFVGDGEESGSEDGEDDASVEIIIPGDQLLDAQPQSLQDVCRRNVYLANTKAEQINKRIAQAAIVLGLITLFAALTSTCLGALWIPVGHDGLTKIPPTAIYIGAAIGAIALTALGLAVAWGIRRYKQKPIRTKRAAILTTTAKKCSGLELSKSYQEDPARYFLLPTNPIVHIKTVKAISQACREAMPELNSNHARGTKARYQLEYYHPHFGPKRTELLAWPQLQDKVKELEGELETKFKIDRPEFHYRVFYNYQTKDRYEWFKDRLVHVNTLYRQCELHLSTGYSDLPQAILNLYQIEADKNPGVAQNPDVASMKQKYCQHVEAKRQLATS